MRILFIACIALVALVCGSCFEKGDCIINNTNLVKFKFINTLDKTVHPVKFASIEVVGSSIVLYNNNVEVSLIALPVDPYKTEASFILKYADTRNDTINVTYRNQTTIPSSDCGAFVYQDQVTLVENPMDTSLIQGSTLTKVITTQLLGNAEANFEVYF